MQCERDARQLALKIISNYSDVYTQVKNKRPGTSSNRRSRLLACSFSTWTHDTEDTFLTKY